MSKAPTFIVALPWWQDALYAIAIALIALLPLYLIHRITDR